MNSDFHVYKTTAWYYQNPYLMVIFRLTWSYEIRCIHGLSHLSHLCHAQ